MAEDRGFCDMRMLLQSFKESEGDEAVNILKTIADHLRNAFKMKEHFHELNGTSVILNGAITANFPVLNVVFDTLASAAEDHEGNRMHLTHECTFVLIHKVLISIDSLGLMASAHPLVLLSYVSAENPHAHELANISGCVKEMEKLFLRFSQEILVSADVKEEKLVFTWNVLCTAIAAVCGEPPNQKNQDILRSVVREGINFLNEFWTDKSRITPNDISYVKNLLIMLPYVVHSNKANQDFFARSGGVHAIVKCFTNSEKKNNLDCDCTEIYIKLVYLLSVSLTENPQISKLAGFLGVIPVLVQLMKQLTKKDKGIVLLCLANLLSCPENVQIFHHWDISTYLTSEMNVFGENSECWKLINKICSHLRRTQKSNCDLDLSGSSNSSLLEEKTSHSLSRYMQNGEKKMEKYRRNEEFDLNSEKKFNNTSSMIYHKKFSDSYHFDQHKYKNYNEYPQTLPSYYKRAHNIKNDNLVDEQFRKRQYNRKKNHYEHGEISYHRDDDSESIMLNRFHKFYDKSRQSNSLDDYSKKDTYTTYDDGYFPKHENTQNRQLLQIKDSSSDLINRARRLYPRNKMSELEEIDVHQRRHYFTKRENFARLDEIGKEQLRTLDPRSLKDYFDADSDLRENYGRRTVKGSLGSDLKKDWQRTPFERYTRDYYDTDTEERKGSTIQGVGRQSRIDKPRKDYPKSPSGSFIQDYLDDQNGDHRRKLMGLAKDNYHTAEDSRNPFCKRPLERYSREDGDKKTELHKENVRLSWGRGRVSDSEKAIRREQERGFMDTLTGDYTSVTREPWKDDPKQSRAPGPLEALKRSKSVGRLNEMDIQSMFKDMELVRSSTSGKSSSPSSDDKKVLNSPRRSRDESPVMPMLLSIRDTQLKTLSPPQSPKKSCLKTPSELETNTQSTVSFKNKEGQDIQTKYENHYSGNNGTINQKENDNKSTETGGTEQSANSSVKLVFSEEEEKNLVQGIEKFGLDFKKIYQEFKFQEKRTPHDLYEKWKYSYNL